MAYWHISGWQKKIYPHVIWDIRNREKTLYFSFDDGPTPGITEEVLNLLASFNARATFFCLGRNTDRYPEVYQKILEQGHSVGNHTYSHLKGWKTQDELYYKDIDLAAQHISSNLFRPPYGQISRSQTEYLSRKYKVILWEVMSHDYESRLSADLSLRKVLRYTKSGSILVFHDSVKAWPKLQYILPRVLEHFSREGYNFEAIKME